jgi:hypothetical protein
MIAARYGETFDLTFVSDQFFVPHKCTEIWTDVHPNRTSIRNLKEKRPPLADASYILIPGLVAAAARSAPRPPDQ